MNVTQAIKKFVGSKAKVLSTAGTLALAGAALAVATPAAHAQVAFGVEFGPRYYAPAPRPVYVAPAYAGVPYGYGYGDGYVDRGYRDHFRYDEWRAREWRDRGNLDRGRFPERDRNFHERGWGR